MNQESLIILYSILLLLGACSKPQEASESKNKMVEASIEATKVIVEQKLESASSNESIGVGEIENLDSLFIKEKYGENGIISSIDKEAIDSIFIKEFFSNTALTSKEGNFHSGFDYTIHPFGVYFLDNGFKYVIVTKNWELMDGSSIETFVLIANEYDDYIKDVKLIGEIGYFAECSLDLDFYLTENDTVVGVNKMSCADGYDPEEDKTYQILETTTKRLKYAENEWVMKFDSLSERAAIE